jgi:hypothetical protein
MNMIGTFLATAALNTIIIVFGLLFLANLF